MAPNMDTENEVKVFIFARGEVLAWGGLNPPFNWPSVRGVVYKKVVQWYEEGFEAYFQLAGAASEEIWARGKYADELEEWIEVTYEKREVLHKELGALQTKLKEVVDEVRGTKKEVEVLKAKLLKSEVAREKAEAEWKTLVEQRDKWRREAEKTKKEKDKLEKDLRQELRAVKLVARRAPTTTSATQTHPPPTSHSTTTQDAEAEKVEVQKEWMALYPVGSILRTPETQKELAVNLGVQLRRLRAERRVEEDAKWKERAENKKEADALRAMLVEATKKAEEEKKETSREMGRVLGT